MSNPAMATPEVYPLAVLIDESKHDDTAIRVAAMERSPTVASALGEERSRAELVPFSNEVAKEDEDEISTLMAEQLGAFTEYVGGPAYAHSLVEPLAALIVCEEPIVRDTAIASMAKLAREMDAAQSQEHLVPLVLSSSASDWFSSRIGAAGSYPVTFECAVDAQTRAPRYTPESLAELYANFAQLAADDAPMVRRACGQRFPEIVKFTPEKSDVRKLVPVFMGMCEDTQDSVKSSAVDAAIALAHSADGAALVPESTAPIFQSLDDKSWRVRYQAADRFNALAHAISGSQPSSGPSGPSDSANSSEAANNETSNETSNENTKTNDSPDAKNSADAKNSTNSGDASNATDASTAGATKRDTKTHLRMLQTFVQLTNDPEAEVRTAIAKQVVAYTQDLVSVEEVVRQIVPCLESSTSDPGEGIREALAGKIAYMAPKIGKDNTITYLLPSFLDMSRDEHSEVRSQIISNLDVINEIIGIDRLSESLLPAISDLAKDKQWRVSLAVIDYSPLLAKQLGVEFFNKEIVPLVFQWLWDPVWAIRDAAAENSKALADVFGIAWLEAEIVPKSLEPNGNGNYSYRLTSSLTLKKIAARLSPQTLVQTTVPFIIASSHDPVPNVRFNCATTLAIIANRIAAEHAELIKSDILPVIERLTEDQDVDVRFFASEASKSIHTESPNVFE